jgi:hypothetical protein
MEIILNIIHGRTKKVSRGVDVPALKQIVGLIDKYEFHEAVEMFTDMWFDYIRRMNLDGERQQLVSGNLISFVLKRPAEHQSLTRRAIWEIYRELKDNDGLVSYWIFGGYLRRAI